MTITARRPLGSLCSCCQQRAKPRRLSNPVSGSVSASSLRSLICCWRLAASWRSCCNSRVRCSCKEMASLISCRRCRVASSSGRRCWLAAHSVPRVFSPWTTGKTMKLRMPMATPGVSGNNCSMQSLCCIPWLNMCRHNDWLQALSAPSYRGSSGSASTRMTRCSWVFQSITVMKLACMPHKSLTSLSSGRDSASSMRSADGSLIHRTHSEGNTASVVRSGRLFHRASVGLAGE